MVLFALGIVSMDKMKQKLLRDNKALLHHSTSYDETRVTHHCIKHKLIQSSHDRMYFNDTRAMQNRMTYDEMGKLSPHEIQ